MDKRGVIMNIYLVFITAFMCGLVLWLIIIQRDQVSAAIVSPVDVLELEDSLEVFELWEKSLILNSANNNWGDKEKTKDEFCESFKIIDGMKLREFLFKDLYKDGVKISEGAVDNSEEQENFCKTNYDFDYVGEELKVVRSELEKRFTVKPFDEPFLTGKNEKSFKVDVEFVYSGEYSCDKEKCEVVE